MEPLEDRRLLAFSATFSSGALTVTSSDNVDITFSTVYESSEQRVKINGSDPSTGPLAAANVNSISVSDSTHSHTVDLSTVTATYYTSLTSVTINGSGGNDSILGTAFADTINGGAGNDDVTLGSGLNTYLYAPGSGDDSIAGSAGSFPNVDVVEIQGSASEDEVVTSDGELPAMARN